MDKNMRIPHDKRRSFYGKAVRFPVKWTITLIWYWPHKAFLGAMVQHNGIFQELEGTWDGLCGTLSILHRDRERVGGHFISSVFSCPAGDLFSEVLPMKRGTQLNTGGGVAWGLSAVEANIAAVWQLVKSWLCCFSSSLFFHYLYLKCRHGLFLTEHSWPKEQRQSVIKKKKILLMTPKLRSIPF